jgi:hypothetical protein
MSKDRRRRPSKLPAQGTKAPARTRKVTSRPGKVAAKSPARAGKKAAALSKRSPGRRRQEAAQRLAMRSPEQSERVVVLEGAEVVERELAPMAAARELAPIEWARELGDLDADDEPPGYLVTGARLLAQRVARAAVAPLSLARAVLDRLRDRS